MKALMADYGVGNLHSIRKALELAGMSIETVTDMSKLLDAKCVIFPGVGAFDSAVGEMVPILNDIRQMLESGVPALGVCIGNQLLLDGSEEGELPGIGLFPGRVRFLRSETVPHMGWNTVVSDDPVLDGIEGGHFYFAHSYYCDPVSKSDVRGTTEYEGFEFPSIMRRANTVGVQFHPEKSAEPGMRFLRNFAAFAEDGA